MRSKQHPPIVIDSEDESEEDDLEGNSDADSGNNSDEKVEKLSDSDTFGVRNNCIPITCMYMYYLFTTSVYIHDIVTILLG